MQQLTDDQRELARSYGVATEYVDWLGSLVEVPVDTIIAVLGALGADAADPTAAAAAVSAYQDGQQHALPTCVVVRQGQSAEIPLRRLRPAETGLAGSDADDTEVWIELEAGSSVDVTDSVLASTVVVPTDLPLGYHTLRARWSDGAAAGTLIVTPAFLGFPDRLAGQRAWGLATQLYSVRSRHSWGVGDLADLSELVAWSGGELGADYILVNPLSAAQPVAPMEPSPYLPTSRRFVNPMYLRVEEIPEYDDLPPAHAVKVGALRTHAHDELDQLDAIDRDVSWAAKEAALRLVHDVPRAPGREAGYREFVGREGHALRDFSTWCALAELHGADWHEWPAELQHPDHPSVKAFRDDHAPAVEFHAWLQWAVDEQLSAAQSTASRAGMALGIMHDLAVGVHPRGADAWAMQDILAQGINVGAPPDAFNQIGQDWSQPPLRPDRLAQLAYAPYRDLISRLLRHAGAIRIDHIIGLFRLWWIPEGMTADQGTYVHYDHEALIGILALEGHRAGAVVVGEDLGNVDPRAREYLEERGIVGTSLLWFERDPLGHPLPASRWREYSLASVTTHDLPPTAGYLAGDHVELREALGLLTRPVAEERAADEASRAAWLDQLKQEGALEDGAGIDETVTALYRYLTRTPARLVCVALTDAVGDRRTQNQPGTTDEYPNWRVPLSRSDGTPMTLEDVLSEKRVRELAATVQAGIHPR